MSFRSGLCTFLAVAAVAIGFTIWLARRDQAENQARIDRTHSAVTQAPAKAVPAALAQPVPEPDPLPADASVTAREIYARGKARMAEDEKIRQSIAEGQPAPLPEHLRVADLPLETPPPRPVRR